MPSTSHKKKRTKMDASLSSFEEIDFLKDHRKNFFCQMRLTAVTRGGLNPFRIGTSESPVSVQRRRNHQGLKPIQNIRTQFGRLYDQGVNSQEVKTRKEAKKSPLNK